MLVAVVSPVASTSLVVSSDIVYLKVTSSFPPYSQLQREPPAGHEPPEETGMVAAFLRIVFGVFKLLSVTSRNATSMPVNKIAANKIIDSFFLLSEPGVFKVTGCMTIIASPGTVDR